MGNQTVIEILSRVASPIMSNIPTDRNKTCVNNWVLTHVKITVTVMSLVQLERPPILRSIPPTTLSGTTVRLLRRHHQPFWYQFPFRRQSRRQSDN